MNNPDRFRSRWKAVPRGSLCPLDFPHNSCPASARAHYALKSTAPGVIEFRGTERSEFINRHTRAAVALPLAAKLNLFRGGFRVRREHLRLNFVLRETLLLGSKSVLERHAPSSKIDASSSPLLRSRSKRYLSLRNGDKTTRRHESVTVAAGFSGSWNARTWEARIHRGISENFYIFPLPVCFFFLGYLEE